MHQPAVLLLSLSIGCLEVGVKEVPEEQSWDPTLEDEEPDPQPPPELEEDAEDTGTGSDGEATDEAPDGDDGETDPTEEEPGGGDTGGLDEEGDHWCWTLAPSSSGVDLWEVDMTTGGLSLVQSWAFADASSFHTGGLARIGSTLVAAGYDGNEFRWFEFDVSTGTHTAGSSTGYQVSVATDGSALYIINDANAVEGYSSFSNLSSGVPATAVPTSIHGTRLGITGGTIYSAWHSTDEVQVHDLATGAYINTIPLQFFDTWVWGLSEVNGVLYVIDDGRSSSGRGDTRIVGFDVATGNELSVTPLPTLTVGTGPSGLWCEAY